MLVVRYYVYKEEHALQSRTSRKTIKIANSRSFSGIWRGYASSLPRISYIAHLELFEPLLGTLASLPDPSRQEELTSSPIHNLLLKAI